MFATLTFTISVVQQTPEPISKKIATDTEETLPQIFMVNSDTVRFETGGQKSHHLIGEHTRYFDEGDRLEIAKPVITFFRDDQQQPWHISANYSHGKTDQSRFVFYENVKIWQNNPAEGKQLITTEKLIVYPNRNYSETDKFVTLTSPNSKTTGTGMRVWFDDQKIELQQSVRGYYEVD